MVGSHGNALLIFDRTANGNAKPLRVIKGPNSGVAQISSFQIYSPRLDRGRRARRLRGNAAELRGAKIPAAGRYRQRGADVLLAGDFLSNVCFDAAMVLQAGAIHLASDTNIIDFLGVTPPL
jgi:hypothetical protein